MQLKKRSMSVRAHNTGLFTKPLTGSGAWILILTEVSNVSDWQRTEAGIGIKKYCSYIVVQSRPTLQSVTWCPKRLVHITDKYDSENHGDNNWAIMGPTTGHFPVLASRVNTWCKSVEISETKDTITSTTSALVLCRECPQCAVVKSMAISGLTEP